MSEPSMLIQDLIFGELAEVFAADNISAEQLAARLVVSVQLQLGILAQAFGLPRSVQAAMETARVVSAEKLRAARRQRSVVMAAGKKAFSCFGETNLVFVRLCS